MDLSIGLKRKLTPPPYALIYLQNFEHRRCDIIIENMNSNNVQGVQ